MRNFARELRRWVAAGERVTLVTVVRASGSAPRPAGAKMGVTASGQVAGSVSGGCVEGAVFDEAQAVLACGRPKCLHYGIADETAWEVGLACGGVIDVYVEPLVEWHSLVLQAVEAGAPTGLATRLEGNHALAWPDGRQVGDPVLANELMALFPGPVAELRNLPDGEVFFEIIPAPPVLTIVGAVHVAIPLVDLAQDLGFYTQVIDPRRTFATQERFPEVDELILAWPQDALGADQLGTQHYVLILSHDPKFDLPALEIALRSRAAYVGLVGARSTQAARRQALRERGLTDEELARIHGPIGLDLGGKQPAEIALAIMAEIVAVRHGRLGGKLSTQ